MRWWRWRRPKLIDCRVLALDRAGRVLLVRHSYGVGVWMLPGGGRRLNETPIATATRELREEVNCTLLDPIEVAHPDPQANRVRYVVVGRCRGEPRADRREIVQAGFFALDDLPRPILRALPAALPVHIAAYSKGS